MTFFSSTHSSDSALVTVASFPEPADANLARSVLEAAGIEAYLRSANANSMIPVAFESELQVRAADEAAAREALESVEDHPASMAEVTAAEQADELQALPGKGTED
jgi:hypothetical protein